MNTENSQLISLLCALIAFLAAIGIAIPPNGKKQKLCALIYLCAWSAIFWILISLWSSYGRPPMRSMAETRMWYSFGLLGTSFFIFYRWKYRWMPCYAALMSCVFLTINILSPELANKNLMPALQSVWFVPHVSAYMISYALLGVSCLLAIKCLVNLCSSREVQASATYEHLHSLVYRGFAFLMIGLVLGALWGKEAWGQYWAWDPKETWALITLIIYLLYIHCRQLLMRSPKVALLLLLIAFASLLITWKGVNYLSSAQQSKHRYSVGE